MRLRQEPVSVQSCACVGIVEGDIRCSGRHGELVTNGGNGDGGDEFPPNRAVEVLPLDTIWPARISRETSTVTARRGG